MSHLDYNTEHVWNITIFRGWTLVYCLDPVVLGSWDTRVNNLVLLPIILKEVVDI